MIARILSWNRRRSLPESSERHEVARPERAASAHLQGPSDLRRSWGACSLILASIGRKSQRGEVRRTWHQCGFARGTAAELTCSGLYANNLTDICPLTMGAPVSPRILRACRSSMLRSRACYGESSGATRHGALVSTLFIFLFTSINCNDYCGGGGGCAAWAGRWQPVATDEVLKALLSVRW